MGTTLVIVTTAIIPVALFFAYLVIRVRYKKAGPDEALIVFGRRKLTGRKVRDAKGQTLTRWAEERDRSWSEWRASESSVAAAHLCGRRGSSMRSSRCE